MGRRATTHPSALAELGAYGAIATDERVVDEVQVVAAGGVIVGIDLGLHPVERLMGAEVRQRIAAQMDWPRG